MQKSVLIPIEKYERLVGKVKEAHGISAATEAVPSAENLEGEGDEESSNLSKHSSTQTEQPASTYSEPLESGNSETDSSPKQKAVPKRRRRLPPPGLRDWRSLWVKIDGRL